MIVSKLARTTLIFNKPNVYGIAYRNLSNQPKENIFRRSIRSAKNVTVSNGSGAPSYTPIAIGQGLVAAASLIGIGSLAYYGLGLSNQTGIVDRASVWPQLIRDRVSSTYEYFGATLGMTAASAFAASKNPAIMRLVSGNSMMALVAFFAATMGSQMLVRSLPYESGKISSKHLAWALHAGIMGAFLAPLTLLGGPLLVRAAWYTAGTVGGLSVIAATAPSEKFLNMGGPLAMGLGLVFASSIGSMFLPPTTRMGLSLYSISIYGGLILFSMMLLYDTQRIVQRAEQSMHYDPINESISIYMNTINIFVRMATILSGQRKK